MSHSFGKGDTVRCARTGLEAEVTGFAELDPDLILCGWFDWLEDYQEVYFMASELILLRTAAKQEVESKGA